MAETAHAIETEFTPRPHRTPMVANLEIFRNGARIGTARTRNISERGIGGTGFLPLRVNQKVTVAVDGSGQVPAHVVWLSGPNFGLSLEQPIAVGEFDMATTLSGDWRPV